VRRKERRVKERHGCAYLSVDDDDGSMTRWSSGWDEQDILSINDPFGGSRFRRMCAYSYSVFVSGGGSLVWYLCLHVLIYLCLGFHIGVCG